MLGPLKQSQHTVVIRAGAHPSVIAIMASHSPEIEVTVVPVSGGIEHCRAGHAMIMAGFVYKSCFEFAKIRLRLCVYQRKVHDKKCIVSRQRKRISGDTGARFYCIRDRLPPVPQRVRKSKDRIWLSGVHRKSGCDRIGQQHRGECNAVAPVPRRI